VPDRFVLGFLHSGFFRLGRWARRKKRLLPRRRLLRKKRPRREQLLRPLRRQPRDPRRPRAPANPSRVQLSPATGPRRVQIRRVRRRRPALLTSPVRARQSLQELPPPQAAEPFTHRVPPDKPTRQATLPITILTCHAPRRRAQPHLPIHQASAPLAARQFIRHGPPPHSLQPQRQTDQAVQARSVHRRLRDSPTVLRTRLLQRHPSHHGQRPVQF